MASAPYAGTRSRVGDSAIWDSAAQTVTCLTCALADAPVDEGHAGASAQREYDRRHQRREQHAKDKLGALGTVLAHVIDEPRSTTNWQKGARGEQRTAARLTKHLQGQDVKLLHDRRIPCHGQANIDHLAVGPGGITVIDSKTHTGAIRVERVGGLFTDRHQILLIAGRDRTELIDCLERQLHAVRTVLHQAGIETDLRGALCFPEPDGLPIFRQLAVREIVIDGPKQIAKLARRAGPLEHEQIDRIWRHLASALPLLNPGPRPPAANERDRRRLPPLARPRPAGRSGITLARRRYLTAGQTDRSTGPS